jgi:hypothetical protein
MTIKPYSHENEGAALVAVARRKQPRAVKLIPMKNDFQRRLNAVSSIRIGSGLVAHRITADRRPDKSRWS